MNIDHVAFSGRIFILTNIEAWRIFFLISDFERYTNHWHFLVREAILFASREHIVEGQPIRAQGLWLDRVNQIRTFIPNGSILNFMRTSWNRPVTCKVEGHFNRWTSETTARCCGCQITNGIQNTCIVRCFIHIKCFTRTLIVLDFLNRSWHRNGTICVG